MRTDPVSVAISTRDRAAALDRCLDSLRHGTHRPDEVVVVDQSADDATRLVVERHRTGGLPARYRRSRTRGLGASQNEAFAHAACAIVAVIDDDCIADSRWLETIVAVMARRPDVDGVTGRVLPLPATGDRTEPVSSRTSEQRRELGDGALPWEVGSGNNFALRAAAFARIGGCDERLGPGAPALGGVDMDLFHRLTRNGSRIAYEPAAVVHHERQTPADRARRRVMYGHGMGAAIALWRRAGDATAHSVLSAWVALRLRQMGLAVRRGDWRDVRAELTVLAATGRGLVAGPRLALLPRRSTPAADVSSSDALAERS